MTEEESEAVSFKTKVRIPSKPLNVQITVFGSSAHINWQPPLYPNGYIETYEINIIKSDQRLKRAVPTTIRKDRRSREVYIRDSFEPYTYYDVKVAARNRKGKGRPWFRVLFTVSAPDSKLYFQKYNTFYICWKIQFLFFFQAKANFFFFSILTVPAKPGAPMAKPFKDSAINITFQLPTFGGLPNYFKVYYRPRGKPNQVRMVKTQMFPERAWILVTGLDFLVYEFWTVGANDLGLSESSDITEQQPSKSLLIPIHLMLIFFQIRTLNINTHLAFSISTSNQFSNFIIIINC